MRNSTGNESQTIRVAVIGSGPAGFYSAEHLLKQVDRSIEVDMFEKLPVPFGLVRYGVAPDHLKIKSVTKQYERTAVSPRFRFFGNVEIGKDISIETLRQHYHQIIYTVGAQTDRHLRIPGIDLEGSHSATQFVAWYNGHPEFRHCQFDLSQESVVIIGVGNVAIDVARILCLSPEELKATDIADHALVALSQSQVKDVYLLGRRGVAQAAFTPKEAKELGELADAEVVVSPENVALDPLSLTQLEDAPRAVKRNVEIMQAYAEQASAGKQKRLHFRFLTSPTAVYGENGRISHIDLVKNELVENQWGGVSPQPTEETETLPVGLLFSAIGYRGVPIVDVPFDERRGVFLNENGRILNPDNTPKIGEYAAGWIKRGPTGVIGTNKADAVETVQHMLTDMDEGVLLLPQFGSADAALALVKEKKPTFTTYADWQYLDEQEVALGQAQGRPRLKFATSEEMLLTLQNRS